LSNVNGMPRFYSQSPESSNGPPATTANALA
jgi:hypothetical protein